MTSNEFSTLKDLLGRIFLVTLGIASWYVFFELTWGCWEKAFCS